MSDNLDKINKLIKKYIATLMPDISVKDMPACEKNNWNHDYKIMSKNGVMEKLCLINSEVLCGNFVKSMDSYSPDAVVIVRKRYHNATDSIHASPNRMVFIRHYTNLSIKMSIANVENIDTFELLDLFEKTLELIKEHGYLEKLLYYISEKKWSDHVRVEIIKY